MKNNAPTKNYLLSVIDQTVKYSIVYIF